MGRGGAHASYERWINDYTVASNWIAKKDVQNAVDAAGGLVRIENFLPEHVADGILSVLSSIPEKGWNDTSATTDYTHNNISHSFSSVKHAKGLDAVLRLFSLIQPESLNAFSAAKYCKRDHIAPHDDRAYTKVKLDNGRVITTSRTLAVIYYLTRDWREEYGGVLVDLEDPTAPPGEGRRYVPLWNSVVAFRVPRYHAVTAMKTDRPRYSVFGWFLKPGKLYPLYRGDEHEQTPGHREYKPSTAPHERAGGSKTADANTQVGSKRKGGALLEQEQVPQAGSPQLVMRDSKRRKQHDSSGGCKHDREEARHAVKQHGMAATSAQQTGGEAVGASRWHSGASNGASNEVGDSGGRVAAVPVANSLGASNGVAGGSAPLLRKVRLPGRWQGRRKHICIS